MAATKKLTKAQRELAAKRRLQGATLRAIGDELGVAHATVQRALREHADELARTEATKAALANERRRLERRLKSEQLGRPERDRSGEPATAPPNTRTTVHRDGTGNASITFHGEGSGMRVGWRGDARKRDAYADWLDTPKNLPAGEAFRERDGTA